MRITRALLVGLLASGAGMVAAGPAAGAGSAYQIVHSGYLRCLESNPTGVVQMAPCDDGKATQRWEIFNGGFTKNSGTQLCLTGDGLFTVGSIRTAPCDDQNPRQVFQHFPIVGTHCSTPTNAGGCWYQRNAYVDGAGVRHEAECVSARFADAHRVTSVRCGEEERYLRWNVVPKP